MARPLIGLVLRQVDVGEADRIVSLLTAARGRLEVRIPRARKSRKRFGGLDLFVLAEFQVSSKPGKVRVETARVLADFPGIRSDVERLALASHAAELLVLGAPEGDTQPELFRLAVASFESLDRQAGESVGGLGWARGFELKLLHVLGMRPSLTRCVASGSGVGEQGRPLWSLNAGGLLCSSMQEQDPSARPISSLALQRMNQALHLPLAQQAEVPWDKASTEAAGEAMKGYLRQHLGARQRSLAVLHGLLALLCCCFFLQGCTETSLPTSVSVEGYLFSHSDPGEDADPLPGASGAAWDDTGTSLSDLQAPFSAYPGWYRADDLPLETRVHLRFSAADSVTTILTGWTASEDLFVERGVFHLWSRTEALAEVGFWDGSGSGPTLSPEVAEEGGVIVGSLAHPLEYVGTEVWVTDVHGEEFLASGTDALGAPQPATPTGNDGRFALLGVAPGPVEIRIASPGETRSEEAFLSWVEEDSVTSLPGFMVR